MKSPALHKSNRTGIVSILALLFLCIFASLSVAFASTTDLTLQKANNFQAARKARLATESGLDFLVYKLKEFKLGVNLSGQALFDDLASSLQGKWNGTANLGGSTVAYDDTNIVIPSITIGGNLSFSAILSMADSNMIGLTVTGYYTTNSGTSFSRSVSMDFNAAPRPPALEYGVYSKGPIHIGNNLIYRGANSPDEASFYTEASDGRHAVTIGSDGYIDGNIDVMDEFGTVSLSSGTTVNGSVTVGVPQTPFPEVDGSVFVSFATNIMDASTPRANVTLINLRIPGDTNPQFTQNVKLMGVIYIESPNYVYFKNNVVLIGVIVTEDPAGSGGINKIEFKNNLDIRGVEELPDTDENQFSAIRQLTGSGILAPGFDLEFKNNPNMNSGTIACESLILNNDIAVQINGALIIGSGGLTLKQNTTLTIDRSGLTGLPAGTTMLTETMLTPNPDAYLELH